MAGGKEIRFGVEGRAAMLRGVDLLADAVQVRLMKTYVYNMRARSNYCVSDKGIAMAAALVAYRIAIIITSYAQVFVSIFLTGVSIIHPPTQIALHTTAIYIGNTRPQRTQCNHSPTIRSTQNYQRWRNSRQVH